MLGEMKMKHVKTLLSVILCAFLMVTCFSGCKKSKKSLLDPQNPTTVVIWNYYNGDQLDAFEKLVKEFNNTIGAQEGIIVESVSQGNIDTVANNLIDSVEKKVGAADVPNAAAIYSETAYILNQKKAIVPLDDFFTEKEFGEYISAFVEEGRLTNKGKILLLPVSKSTEAFIINTTDWDKFTKASGITADSIQTYEDLTKAAEAYYNWTDSLTPDVANDGKALYGRDSAANYIYIGTKQLDHEMFKVSEDGKISVDIDRATFKTLWDNYYIPYINGYFAANAKYRSEDIKTCSIISMTGSTSGISYIPTKVTTANDENYDIDIAVKKSLSFKNSKSPVSVQQGAGYCILKTTEAEEYATAEFLKWFTNTEQNLDFSISSGYSPVKTKSNDAETIKAAFKAETPKQQNMLNALIVSAEVFKSGNTYTCRPFDGSKDTRTFLDTAMDDIAKADRATVVASLKAGKTRAEAVSGFTTEEYFNQWFEGVQKRLEAVAK